MNEIIIQQQDFSYVVKKKDIWIVYMTNGKHWICEVDGIDIDDKRLITLKLATRGKCEKND